MTAAAAWSGGPVTTLAVPRSGGTTALVTRVVAAPQPTVAGSIPRSARLQVIDLPTAGRHDAAQ